MQNNSILDLEPVGFNGTKNQWSVLDDTFGNSRIGVAIDAKHHINVCTTFNDIKSEEKANVALILAAKAMAATIQDLINHFKEESTTAFSAKWKAVEKAQEVISLAIPTEK